jgi:protein SCO1
MYRIAYLLLISFMCVCCAKNKDNSLELPYYNEPNFTPLFIADKSEVKQKITHQINNFSFLNQDSVIISQENIEGKIHVANFIFTKCGIVCPILTKNLKVVSDSLSEDNDLVFLSYSVTPWLDSPSVLNNYKKKYGIQNANWHFLTGNKSDIYSLARKAYFAEEDLGFAKDSTEFLHTEHFILVDKNKHIRGVYNGTLSFEMLQLINDIKTLKEFE